MKKLILILLALVLFTGCKAQGFRSRAANSNVGPIPTPPPGGPAADTIMNEGFETHVPTDDAGSTPFRLSGNQDFASVSTAFAKSGTKSIKSRVPNEAQSGVRPHRSEIQHKGGGTITPSGGTVDDTHEFGDIRTYGWSFFLDSGFDEDPQEDIIMQLKNRPDPGDNGNPLISIRMGFSNIKYNIKHSQDNPHSGATTVFGNLNSSFSVGVWHEFAIEVLYDWRLNINGGQGYVKIWYKENGTINPISDLIVDYDGPVGFNDVDGSTSKSLGFTSCKKDKCQ